MFLGDRIWWYWPEQVISTFRGLILRTFDDLGIKGLSGLSGKVSILFIDTTEPQLSDLHAPSASSKFHLGRISYSTSASHLSCLFLSSQPVQRLAPPTSLTSSEPAGHRHDFSSLNTADGQSGFWFLPEGSSAQSPGEKPETGGSIKTRSTSAEFITAPIFDSV